MITTCWRSEQVWNNRCEDIAISACYNNLAASRVRPCNNLCDSRRVGISDHSLVFAIHTNQNTCNLIKVRNLHKINTDKFREDLKNLPWDDIKHLEGVNEQWSLWRKLFLTVVDSHAPLKSKRIRNRKTP